MRVFLRKAFYSTLDTGKAFERRIYLLDETKQKISFWNDVPLKIKGETDPTVFNAGIEIPRYSLGKFEVRKTEPYHPIVQDIRKNKINRDKTELRYYAQYGSFNYGFFPQTWENCFKSHKDIDNLMGDNDPLDLIEVSDSVFEIGSIIPVRVLGAFALIDEGELDWKIVCINKDESDKKKIKTIQDLETNYPHRMNAIIRWFKNYKTFDGKLVNKIHFDDAILDIEKTLDVIEENHQYWKELKAVGEKLGQEKGSIDSQLTEIAQKFYMK